MFDQSVSMLLGFSIYLLIIFLIAVIAWKKTRSATDYFLGGRKLSPLAAALSAGASDASGWVLLGLPGYAYLAGLEAVWIAVGLCIGLAFNWWLSAKRLRIFSLQLGDALTIPTYLERRFNPPNVCLRVLASAFILLFFLFYVAAGFIGAGKLFVTIMDLSYHQAVLIGAAVVICYTIFGGFLAVSWTDVFQALLVTLALVLVPIIAITSDPASNNLIDSLKKENPELLNFHTNVEGRTLSAIALVSLLGWGLAYFGQPHILARFKAVKSANMITVASTLAISWSLLVYSSAIVVGLCGIAYLPNGLDDSEKVFMMLVAMVFHPLVAGFLLAAILAAIMSTVDSQLLVSASTLAEDLYPLRGKKPLDNNHRVMVGRISVAILAIIATAIAMDENSRILDVVAYAWGGLGAALGPVILLSLYWRRMNWQGAIAGVLVGGVTVILWQRMEGGIFELYELVPGFFLSLATIIFVSLVTKEPHQNVVIEFSKFQCQLKDNL